MAEINLTKLAGENFPANEVAVIDAKARAGAVAWGFFVLALTILGGLIVYMQLDGAGHDTNTLREFLQTTIAGEIGLLAGLLGSRNSA